MNKMIKQAVNSLCNSQRRRLSTTIFSRCKEIPPPLNLGIQFVPRQRAFVIERFGVYHRTLFPGIHILPPLINKIAYVQPLQEVTINIEDQPVLTVDSFFLHIDSTIVMQIVDPVKASYGLNKNPFDVSVHIAQNWIACAFARVQQHKAFNNKIKANLNAEIRGKVSKAVHVYGLKCVRFRIRNMYTSPPAAQSMKMLVDAEQKLSEMRAAVLSADGALVASRSCVEPITGSKFAEQDVLGKEAEQFTALLQPGGSVLVQTCSHYSLGCFAAVGWVMYESKYPLVQKYPLQDYESLVVDLANAVIHSTVTSPKYQLTEEELNEKTVELKESMEDDLQECLDLIGMRLVDFNVGWEESKRANVAFQVDNALVIDDLLKKVTPLIEAARPYSFPDFSRWKLILEFAISRMPIEPEVANILKMLLDQAATYFSRNHAMEVEEIGIEPSHIYCVMTMARVTRGAAVEALKSNKGDIIKSIDELTHRS